MYTRKSDISALNARRPLHKRVIWSRTLPLTTRRHIQLINADNVTSRFLCEATWPLMLRLYMTVWRLLCAPCATDTSRGRLTWRVTWKLYTKWHFLEELCGHRPAFGLRSIWRMPNTGFRVFGRIRIVKHICFGMKMDFLGGINLTFVSHICLPLQYHAENISMCRSLVSSKCIGEWKFTTHRFDNAHLCVSVRSKSIHNFRILCSNFKSFIR